MLGFVQNWFSARANPIGVDFGGDCLRMAQVEVSGREPRLVAAASADVPSHLRGDPAARMTWLVETIRDLLSQGGFHGRQAVLALPASWTHIQHLRLAKMDEPTLVKALPWELKGKIPIDPSRAILRHLIAADVQSDQNPQSEIIVMAAARERVEQYLISAAKAKLDVIGLDVQPRTIVDCFSRIYRRKTDQEAISAFIDIGHGGTRAVIAQGEHIRFARMIPIGGEHFNQAVAQAMNISEDEARLLRTRSAQEDENLAEQESPLAEPVAPAAAANTTDPSMDQSMALLEAGLRRSTPDASPQAAPEKIEQQRRDHAVGDPLNRLSDELDLCRRYYEATFPNQPVTQLIFVGGEARHRGLCRQIAQRLSLAAQVGDPLVRMRHTSQIGPDSGIDRRRPQPQWAVAIGLSLCAAKVAVGQR